MTAAEMTVHAREAAVAALALLDAGDVIGAAEQFDNAAELCRDAELQRRDESLSR